MTKIEISTGEVSKRIYTLRGVQVMLDSDLAEIYEAEVRILKRAVRQNIERFPDDFMFELSKEEVGNLRSKFRISNMENSLKQDAKPILRSKFDTSSLEKDFGQRGGNRRLPFAFTELGVAMLSSVLHSPRAIQINIEIMRLFVQLRKQTKAFQLDLIPRVDSLEKRIEQLEIRKPSRTLSNFAESEQVRVIQNAVARRWGLKAEDLKSAARSRDVALPRHIAIYLVRKQLHMSFSEIGRCFGRRDHSTILYAYHKITAAFDVNRMIRDAVNSVQSEIG